MAAYEAEVNVGPGWTLLSGGVGSGANVTIQAFGAIEIRAGTATAPASTAIGVMLEDGGLILATTLAELTPNETTATEVWARAIGSRQSVTARIWHS